MRRFRWLPWLSSSVVVTGTSLLLSPSCLKAEALDEAKVKGALMQRFDENRNDKLDAGEARQTRARLKNLLEDKSEREINIQTWREDVRELLQSIDYDGDNRLSVAERDAGRDLLNRLIPAVDLTAPKERETSSPSVVTPKKDKGSDKDSEWSRRAGHYTRGSNGGRYGTVMGGGGFGMSAAGSDTSNPWLSWFNGMNSTFGTGLGSTSTGGSSTGGGSSASGGLGMSGAGGTGMGGSEMSSGRPGMGDPGSSMGGAMAAAMGSGSAGAGNPAAQPNFGGNSMSSGAMNPSAQGPLGDMGSGPGSTPGAPSPTAGMPGATPGGPMRPMTPDGLGGGMPPPTAGGPSGTGGASAVPSNPMPNF